MAGVDLGATVRLPTDKNFEPRISNTTTHRQVFLVFRSCTISALSGTIW